METYWIDIDEKVEKREQEEDLIEKIRERREKNNLNDREKLGDIFVTQALVCVVVCLVLLVVSFFAKEFSGNLVEKYHSKTSSEIENFVLDITEKIDAAI